MKIGIIGGGIAGLSAAWFLARRHKVVLLEASHRLGGHANTVLHAEDGQTLGLDAFEIARTVIPELTAEQAAVQLEVLKVTVELCTSEQLGYSNPKAWQESVDFMFKTGMLKKKVAINDLYSNQFIR